MRRAAATVGIGLLLFTLSAGIAGAHAGFVSSEPADGGALPASPPRIAIVFTETPDIALSTVKLVDAGGVSHPLGPLEADGIAGIAAAVPETLDDGVYTVSWTVVSSSDGHVTAGAFAFAVGDAVAPPSGAGPQRAVTKPTVVSVASKTALYAGIALLLASAVVGLGLFGGRPARLHVVALAASLVGFAGAAGLLIAERSAVDVPMDDLLRSATGRPYLWLLVTSLVAAVTAVVAAARNSWRNLLWVTGAAAAVMAFLRASSGHAAAGTVAPFEVTIQCIHVVAVSIWTGGLVLLALTLRDPGPPPVERVRRFSTVAFWSVLVVVTTGVLRVVSEIGGPSAMLDALGRGYGVALAVKVGLAAMLIGLGGLNRWRSIPRLRTDARPLRRIVRAEILVAFGIAITTATLTGLDPAGGASAATPVPAVVGVAQGVNFAGTMQVDVTATPGTPGSNAFEVRITDPGTGAAVEADDVTLRFASVGIPDLPPVEVPLARAGDRWRGQAVAPSVAGMWTVTARVITGADAVEIGMTMVTRSDAAGAPVTGAPLTTASFPSGVSVQLSLEDAEGTNAFVHVTALAPDGSEIAIRGATVTAVQDGEPARVLDAQVVSTGHAIAQTTLDAGSWTVDAVVTTRDGRSFEATLVEVPLSG